MSFSQNHALIKSNFDKIMLRKSNVDKVFLATNSHGTQFTSNLKNWMMKIASDCLMDFYKKNVIFVSSKGEHFTLLRVFRIVEALLCSLLFTPLRVLRIVDALLCSVLFTPLRVFRIVEALLCSVLFTP
jgi:hypothetical protein